MTVPAHVAVPEGAGPWPGVVVVHEAFGLNDDIREIADRFAAAGYLAAAPDLLSGVSRLGRFGCLLRTFRDLQSGRGPTVEALLSWRSLLTARADCTGHVGIVGFCLGGGFAILLADKGFDASAPFYGRLPSRLDEIAAGSCPMVASYGADDRSLRGAADRLRSALEAAGTTHDVREYAGAGHSFANRSTPPAWMRPTAALLHAGYVDTAAEDAWDRMLAMFGEALRPAP